MAAGGIDAGAGFGVGGEGMVEGFLEDFVGDLIGAFIAVGAIEPAMGREAVHNHEGVARGVDVFAGFDGIEDDSENEPAFAGDALDFVVELV